MVKMDATILKSEFINKLLDATILKSGHDSFEERPRQRG